MAATVAAGRLVLADGVVPGRLVVEAGRIVEVVPDPAAADGPYLAPGYADLHVHGFGGHDAMGGEAALDGMARALLRRGVTTFLPTSVTAPLDELLAFGERVRARLPHAADDAARIVGCNLEGPFLAPARRGAQRPDALLEPAAAGDGALDPLLGVLRVVTVAPELPGALAIVRRLAERGVVVALGHSAATLEEAEAGYAAGARSTTHLFNAMSGVDHRSPGLAVAALAEDRAAVELIADGEHVHPALWRLVLRAKPAGRVVLVSDALPLAGTTGPGGSASGTLGGLAVEVHGARAVIAGTATLAGSVTGLDGAVRNLVATGIPLHRAVAAASADPLALLGIDDRGRLEPGRLAHLVELDDRLHVRRVTLGDRWIDAGPRVG